MKAIGNLLTAISHEINNPLTGILGTAQVLLAEISSSKDDQLLDDIQEIEGSAQRALQIIENLLGFGSNSNESTCSVTSGIDSAIKFSKSSLRDIHVNIEVDSDLSKIEVPRSSFQQILFNIITNASNAMTSKGRLRVHAKRSSSHFAISLEDNGKGMNKETLHQIFEPFFSQRNKGRGTGLGMVIVKDLVNRMNGSIEINSKVGTGTEVHLNFPIQSEAR